MLTGSLSGLISILAHSVLWSGVEMVRGAPTDAGASRSAVAVSEALLHMLCGVGLGSLFWLSWGLAAIVDVAWWARGLAFAGLSWIALTAPMLLDLALSRRLSAQAAALVAVRWASTCVIASVACAWSWDRML